MTNVEKNNINPEIMFNATSEEIKEVCISTALKVFSETTDNKKIAIKTRERICDTTNSDKWTCIVGKDFYSTFDYCNKNCIHFYLEDKAFLIFQC